MNAVMRLVVIVLLGVWVLPVQAARTVDDDIPSGSWLTQAQQELAQREYHISESGKGVQAPNRAQGFRTYFGTNGIELVTRDTAAQPLAQLLLAGYGRDRMLRAPGEAGISMANNRVTLQWSGISAVYDNTESGLEQRWVLKNRPKGETNLTIVWEVAEAKIQPIGSGVSLESEGGHLRIAQFQAVDASGILLPLEFSAEGHRLRLNIADGQARYPITVQSIIDNANNGLLEANQASANYGFSVAGAGDVNGDGYADVVVGANLYDNGQADEGAAFIYFGGSGVFNTTADALLESNQAASNFGYSVAGAGDVNGDGYADVLVGAYQYDNGEADEGAVFIYFGGAGSFNTTADAQLEVNQSTAYFGEVVAAAGDINGDGYGDVLVGATDFANGQNFEGAAFVYFGGSGAFNTTVDALLEANQAFAHFGYSLAGAGDVNGDGYADVVVGAYQYDNGQVDEGAAFIYFGGAGAFDTTADAQMESNQADAFFGASVAGAGDVNGDGYSDILIGVHGYDNGQSDEGLALVYFGGAGAFNTTADGQLEANQANAVFGVSVAGAGDINGDGYADVVVGAYLYDNGETDEGAAFVYFGGTGVFNTTVDAILEINQVGASFGYSVVGAGDVNGDGYADVLVGAHHYDNGQTDEGAAFIYFGGAGDFITTVSAQLEANQASAGFGSSIAGVGDVNGDGYSDVVVGANLYDNGQADEGAAFVYFGGAGAFNTSTVAQLEINVATAYFGFSVAAAGDVNGDGYADVLVGAPFYKNGQTDEGAAFVYFGGAGPFNTVADATLELNQAGAALGYSVAGAGDVNGDGYADVVVGAYQYDNGQIDEGAAFVYFGGKGAFDTTYDAQLEANQANAYFGQNVTGAGDVNGDGYADVLVGAPYFFGAQIDEGAAFVYFGGAGAFNTTADAQLEVNLANSYFGQSVAGAGDVNGDGYSDVIVGAPFYSTIGGGAAFVYFGGPGTFSTTVAATLGANQAGAHFGSSVASAGDVNGDGYADVVVGAPWFQNGQANEGAAFVFYGGAGTFNTTLDAQLEGNQASAHFGISVAGSSDVNGDGFADVLVGAPYYVNGQTEEGAAFVYHGTATGRLVMARQLRGGGSIPAEHWGLSQQSDGFVVSLQATSPRGRERARLQVEACPNGSAFGSLVCDTRTSNAWTEIGANGQGVSLSLAITGLTTNLLYHWRSRVQYAPLTVIAAGITTPQTPSAGPWRRFQANSGVADIRTNTPEQPPAELVFKNGFE